MKKTTLYVDIDDDIAAIIDKVTGSPERIIAVVLPKRASVLQSSVNMKLLKRAADDASRSIVLVTTEESIATLAGASGIHVASSLQSKPKIPVTMPTEDAGIVELDQTGSPSNTEAMISEPALDPKAPIGELAGIGDSASEEDSIELDNTAPEPTDSMPEASVKDEKVITKKDKKLAVPNFSSFRTKAFIGLAAVLLLVGAGYYALAVAPKAHVTIKTQLSDAPTKLTIQAKASIVAVNVEANEIPATIKEDVQKLADTFTPTGQKDAGTKATGNVKFYNCSTLDKLGDVTRTIPAGTGISSGGKTFITQGAVDVSPSGFSGSTCKSDKPSAIVKVVASDNGDTYNLSARDYAVAGFSTVTASDTIGMSGGVSKLVKIVSQEDVETGKAKLLAKAAGDIKGKLAATLATEGFVAVQETFVSAQSDPAPAVAVGEESTGDVAITMQVTSTMVGLKSSDLAQVLENTQKKTIDASKQKIYDSGASQSTLSVIERPAKDSVKIAVVASGKTGPILNEGEMRQLIAGKKAGEAKQLIEGRPGVKEATIKLSPFWVFSIPSKQQKITIQFDDAL